MPHISLNGTLLTEGDIFSSESEQEAERVVKNQFGDPRFLDQVHKCIASRRALLGLDGPLRIEAIQVAPAELTVEVRNSWRSSSECDSAPSRQKQGNHRIQRPAKRK